MSDRRLGMLIAVEICVLFWIATALFVFGTL